MELVLIRHAEPARGADDPANPGLSEVGLAQARAVAEHLSDENIDAIWSSPMRRARETAAFVAEAQGIAVSTDDDLAEFDRDAPAYLHFEDLKANGDPRYEAAMRDDLSAWGIDLDGFRGRVVAAFDRIVRAHPGSRVAVVCHGGVANAYLGHVIGLSRFNFHNPAYTGVSRVMASSSGTRTLVSVNETSHLRQRVS